MGHINETTALHEHRLEAIRALRTEYAEAGDIESATLCDRALAGDTVAYEEILDVVTDTTHGGASDEDIDEFYQNIG